MCGKFAQEFNEDKLVQTLPIINQEQLIIPFNNEVSPTDKAFVITFDDNKLTPKMFSWNIIPNWMTNPKFVIFNSRIESVKEKKAWNNIFNNTRCVIPVTGFYEWSYLDNQTKKTKLFFTSKNNEIMFLAGIYALRYEKGIKKGSFSVLTKEADKRMQQFHNRMPIILNKDNIKDYLDKNNYKCINKLINDYIDNSPLIVNR